MNKTFPIVAGVLLAGSALAQTTNFTFGNLVVTAVDITITGSGASGPVYLKEFDLTPSSSPVSTVAFPSSGPGRFVYPWNTNSGLNLNYNAGFFTISGYDADGSVLGLSSSSAAVTPRLIAKIPVAGAITFVSNSFINSGNTPRSVVTDGTDFWAGGSGSATQNGGVQYVLSSGVNSVVSLAPDSFNIRHMGVYNGDLYYTTAGSSLNGLHKYTGLPTTPVNSTQIIATGTAAPASSPYDFVFTNANTVYIADDRTLANGGGVLKYTFDGTSWVYAYTINTALGTGCRAITHLGGNDFAVITNETVSGTTATTPSKIYRLTDGGSDALSTAVLLQTAPSNQNYRGVRYLPGSPSNQTLSGTLALGDTVGAFSYNRNIAYEVKQGVTTIASGTLTVSANSSALSISVP
ncbi:MAG: hypothetical protein JNK63_07000, partial [Chthonomonas sp.]|nr:hypothetical protein [Chthonomonas sp.]